MNSGSYCSTEIEGTRCDEEVTGLNPAGFWTFFFHFFLYLHVSVSLSFNMPLLEVQHY